MHWLKVFNEMKRLRDDREQRQKIKRADQDVAHSVSGHEERQRAIFEGWTVKEARSRYERCHHHDPSSGMVELSIVEAHEVQPPRNGWEALGGGAYRKTSSKIKDG